METVSFGNYKAIPVVAQKHAKLRHRLSADDFRAIMSAEYDKESYRVLGVLIPGVMDIPFWEWCGYVSAEAMANDDYNEDDDPSPTTDEIIGAFEKSLMVSGAGRLGKVMSLAQSMVGLIQTQTPPSLASPGSTGD